MTNRQRIKQRKRLEFAMCLCAATLACAVAALLVMGALV